MKTLLSLFAKVTCVTAVGAATLWGSNAFACTGGQISDPGLTWIVDTGENHSQAHFSAGGTMLLFSGSNGGQFSGSYDVNGCFTQDTTHLQATPYTNIGTATALGEQLQGSLSFSSAVGVLNVMGSPIEYTFTATFTFQTSPIAQLSGCSLSASVTINDSKTWSGHATSSYSMMTGEADIVEDDVTFGSFNANDCGGTGYGTDVNTALWGSGSHIVGMYWSDVAIWENGHTSIHPN